MSDRPTQETDAEYKEAKDYEPSAFVEPLAKFLAVKRERDEAREQVENQRARIGEFFAALEKLTSERDEAREEWGKASMDAAQLLSEKTKAIAERDEAREVLREIAAADWKTSGELRGMAKNALYR